MLLNTLIIFFIFLIGYQIILANTSFREGAENQYDDIAGDAYRLSQQNLADINTLKDTTTKSDENIIKRIDTLDEQMKEVMQSVKEMGNDVTNPSIPTEEGEELKEEEIVG